MPDSVAIHLDNRLSELDKLADAVERFGEANGFSPRTIYQIRLVLDELLTNVISYGYRDQRKHEIGVAMRLADGLLTIRLEDDATAFNPVEAGKPDLECPVEERRIGGLGIHLVKKIMDQVEYERKEGKNLLMLVKTIE